MEWIIIIGIGIVVTVIARKFKAKQYNSSINRERKALLTAPGMMSLSPLEATEYGYRPVGNENLLAVQSDASRLELKSSGTYRTSGASVSIPIVKGVRYRMGGGQIWSEKSWQTTATGRLIVTDKAVAFESPQKNERITWGQIANVELMTDGYQISKRSGPPRMFAVKSPDPKFAAILGLMLSRIE